MTGSKHEKLSYTGFALVILGVFVTLFYFRYWFINAVLGSERTFLWHINLPALAGLFLLLIVTISNLARKERFEFLLGLTPLFSLIPIYLSHNIAAVSLGGTITYFASIVLPILFILISIGENRFKDVIPYVILVLNILLMILFIGAVIDKFFDRAAIKWLASFMTIDRFNEFAYPNKREETRRFFSIIGHPLINNFYANAVFAINHFCRKKEVKFSLPDPLVMVFAGFVNICAGGRAGIVCFIAIIAILFFKNIYVILSAVILGILAYVSGFLNNVIGRFNYKTLDSKRTKHILALLRDKSIEFGWFKGYGTLDIRDGSIYTKYHSAFEQPIIVFAFKYGIVATILLCFIPFFLVSYKLIKRKQTAAFLIWCLLFAQANVMPWLSQGHDFPWMFYFFAFLLVELTDYRKNFEASKKFINKRL